MALYTVRFAVIGGGVSPVTFVVPAGKRAIVTHVACCVLSGTNGQFAAAIAGTFFWYAAGVGLNQAANWAGKAVAYAGETIGLYANPATGNGIMSGYLFNDP